MTGFADHFSAAAKDYSQFRPHYPDALFTFLAQQCAARDRVWDCATGSGQSATQLSMYFSHVIATDASYLQTLNARPHDGVSYATGLAEQTPFVDSCFDLITVAQAVHWFELDRFYAEVQRVLKPDGVLALWTYNLMQINPKIDDVVWHLYNDILGEYWPFERKLVETGYEDLKFPFQATDCPAFEMTLEWSLPHLLGYLSTWSAVKRFKELQGYDPVEELAPSLESAWGNNEMLRIGWPLSVKLGKI